MEVKVKIERDGFFREAVLTSPAGRVEIHSFPWKTSLSRYEGQWEKDPSIESYRLWGAERVVASVGYTAYDSTGRWLGAGAITIARRGEITGFYRAVSYVKRSILSNEGRFLAKL